MLASVFLDRKKQKNVLNNARVGKLFYKHRALIKFLKEMMTEYQTTDPFIREVCNVLGDLS